MIVGGDRDSINLQYKSIRGIYFELFQIAVYSCRLLFVTQFTANNHFINSANGRGGDFCD